MPKKLRSWLKSLEIPQKSICLYIIRIVSQTKRMEKLAEAKELSIKSDTYMSEGNY